MIQVPQPCQPSTLIFKEENMLYTVHFGNNKYGGGNTLYQCVNDAKKMAKLFNSPARNLYTDKQNTRANMLKVFTSAVTQAKAGDQVVVTYSGHGTQVPDRNGDEPDHMDEAIVPIDLSTIIDDVVLSILLKLDPGAQGFLFSDSCFSGTIQRAMSSFSSLHVQKARDRRIRYIPTSLVKEYRGKGDDKKVTSNVGPQPSVDHWVVFGGCADFEYSYEGDNGGVMTDGIFRTGKKGITVQALYDGMSKIVKTGDWVQHPQLSSSLAARKWVVPIA